MIEPMRFLKWGGPEGLENYIIEQTGCKPKSFSKNTLKSLA